MPYDPKDAFMKNYGHIYDRLEPRDQEFIMNSLDEEMEQLRSRSFGDEPQPSLRSMLDRDRTSNVAKDVSEAAQSPSEAEKQADIKELGHVIDDREQNEATWKQRVEERMQASLYEGRGHTDEKMIRSAGQEASSWAEAMRPDKGIKDMERAIKEMGLEPAIERQKAGEAGHQKGQEQGLERGGEGMER